MPAGRPKLQLEDLPDNWKENMFELAKEGASDVELRVTALGGLCHETWTRLIQEEEEFSETVKKCGEECKVWWEKNGRVNLKSKDFNPTLWYMNMKNRFGWADKKEVKNEHSGEIKGINYIVPDGNNN